MTEREYFQMICQIYNKRNPHALIEAVEHDTE